MTENLQPVIVFVDLETTGLDPDRDAITEWAWVYDDPAGAGRWGFHYYVRYDGFPSVWCARNTKAWPRERSKPRRELESVAASFFDDCLRLSAGGARKVYLAGAVPSFDHAFLRRVFREVPYDYHIIDVEAFACGALGLPVPVKLDQYRSLLGIPGQNAKAHDALEDAREAKLIYEAALALRRGQPNASA